MQEKIRQTKNQKIRKDLVFLLNCKRQSYYHDTIFRYCIREGVNQTINQIDNPCRIYYSWCQYDYQGCLIHQRKNVSLRNDKIGEEDGKTYQGIRKVLPLMKLYETSWFKFIEQADHETHNLKYKGCYFQITVEELTFVNDDNYLSKKKVYEQNHEKAIQFYKNGYFQEALKLFMMLVNITENLSKKNNIYTQLELIEMKKWNIKSKQNFIRSFIKIPKIESKYQDLGSTYSKQIIKFSDDQLNNFLRAQYLLKVKYLNDSLIIAQKSFSFSKNPDCQALIDKVNQAIDQKNSKKSK